MIKDNKMHKNLCEPLTGAGRFLCIFCIVGKKIGKFLSIFRSVIGQVTEVVYISNSKRCGGDRLARAGRKVRTPQSRESFHEEKDAAERSAGRKAQQKTNRRSDPARVKRRCKRPPRHGVIRPALQAPPGARSNRE